MSVTLRVSWVALVASLGLTPALQAQGHGLFNTPGFRTLTSNRVDCGFYKTGEFCRDEPNVSTIGGGFWPAGTFNQYIFNSGLQVAGIIGSDGGPWAGDTTGGFFFDPRGSNQSGEGLTDIFVSSDPVDRAHWPTASRINSLVYYPSYQDREAISNGDAWWLYWEANPRLSPGRTHPLGILAETRVLGWQYPSGNQDILYLVTSLYNISSLDPADYLTAPTELRAELLRQAQRFHDLSLDTLGATIPNAGYTVQDFHVALSIDADVGDASNNFASVNLPFAMGYTYDHAFSPFPGWQFDPAIFSPPFFPGVGLVGTKFLGMAMNGSRLPADLRIFQVMLGLPGFTPTNVLELWQLASANIPSPNTCNFNPVTTHLCYIDGTTAVDQRYLQSTGPVTLGPGEHVTLAMAYVFAAPVRVGGAVSCPACDIRPGAPAIIAGMGDPTTVAGGVNTIDSIAGFAGATDLSGDGVLQQDEFGTVPRSLYGKAQVAQAIFDHEFLLPTAPDAPDFFLIPGDNQVTVMWRPSASEQTGDPYFSIAHDAQVTNASGVLVASPLYDPNFRQFDVEGYRVYRGRVDDPAALTLIASYDYAGTVISDYAGQVSSVYSNNQFCAPELGVTSQCPITFDSVGPGLARTAHVDVPLVGRLIQVRLGDRIALSNGSVLNLLSDTVRAPAVDNDGLLDIGVPFSHVDTGVRNNFRYFYSVVAFDVNSFQSGPSSLESPRILKSAVPVRPASNYRNVAGGPTLAVVGRGIVQADTTLPQLDPATGRFSKPMPPANGASLALVRFVKELVSESVTLSVSLDSLELGDAYGAGSTCLAPVPARYYLTLTTPSDTTPVTVLIAQDCQFVDQMATASLNALTIDPVLASRYGGTGSYTVAAQLSFRLAGNYYTNAFGRGCTNGAIGFFGAAGCEYNGARWFDGPSPANNETQDHPNPCAVRVFSTPIVTCFANAGALTGVSNVFEAKSYLTTPNVWRVVEGVLGGAVRGADYNVYWGAAGKVDSVIDVSSNVVVPFEASRAGGSWGILNAAGTASFGPGVNYDERAELSISDISCVEPFKSAVSVQGLIPCGSASYSFTQSAAPGPIVLFTGAVDSNRTMAPRPNPGFLMYLAGHVFAFEMAPGATLPAAGTVWSMRDYIGAIRGGGSNCPNCLAGDEGPYTFTSYSYLMPRTFAAVGAELRLSYDVVNQVDPATGTDLALVHTVPDPYYLRNDFEADAGHQVIKFVNLPNDAIIRIYSSSGVLVTLIEHHSTTFGGAEDWDVRNRTGRRVASGVYFYHIEAGNARRVGRLTIVNDH